MPLKQFEIIPGDLQHNGNGHLVLEIGNQHISCLVKDASHKCVAIELFTHTADEARDFDALVNATSSDSKLLNQTFASTEVIINNELAVLVPSYKFNKEISEDYLRIAFGDDVHAIKSYDAIEIEPVIMNVYRIPSQWHEVLTSRFRYKSIRHIYSSIVAGNFKKDISGETLFVQFYHSHIIVSAYRHGSLLIVQSFVYSGPDDVLYYLLSLCRQLQFGGAGLSVQVSGMIEVESNLYRELVKYFDSVKTEEIDTNHVHAPVGSYPAHYFTPICKLAV